MKKRYMEPECTIVNFENEDIVTTSGGDYTSLLDLDDIGDNNLDFTSNFGG